MKKANISDEGFYSICKALEFNNTVNILNLSRNFITVKSLENILNLIKNNKNIKTLNLDGNNFTSTIKEKIKSYIKKDLKITFWSIILIKIKLFVIFKNSFRKT